jgi:putative membrane protein
VGTVLIACALAFGFAKVQAETQFNDLEIVHIAYTASTIDIRYAHLALALSENPEIRKFAELI